MNSTAGTPSSLKRISPIVQSTHRPVKKAHYEPLPSTSPPPQSSSSLPPHDHRRPISLASTMELMSPEINSLSSDVDDSPPIVAPMRSNFNAPFATVATVRQQEPLALHQHQHQQHHHQQQQLPPQQPSPHMQHHHSHMHMMQHQHHHDGKFLLNCNFVLHSFVPTLYIYITLCILCVRSCVKLYDYFSFGASSTLYYCNTLYVYMSYCYRSVSASFSHSSLPTPPTIMDFPFLFSLSICVLHLYHSLSLYLYISFSHGAYIAACH